MKKNKESEIKKHKRNYIEMKYSNNEKDQVKRRRNYSPLKSRIRSRDKLVRRKIIINLTQSKKLQQ